jgi:hypothetical protein
MKCPAATVHAVRTALATMALIAQCHTDVSTHHGVGSSARVSGPRPSPARHPQSCPGPPHTPPPTATTAKGGQQ